MYQSIDGGRWDRVAEKSTILALAYRGGRLAISLIRMPNYGTLSTRREIGPDDSTDFELTAAGIAKVSDAALGQFRDQLGELSGIVDLTGRQSANLDAGDIERANGFLVNVPGIGRLFAIRPEAVRGWVTGTIPIGRLISIIETKGWLIRGADDKATRQVTIPTLGGHRFYCFKLQAASKLPLVAASASVPNTNVEFAPHAFSSQGIPLSRPLPNKPPTWV